MLFQISQNRWFSSILVGKPLWFSSFGMLFWSAWRSKLFCYSLDPIKSTMILPERFQKKHGKMIMENMILPVQIFLASRDLQYDFPKIGSLRSPVCNFLFTFVQVWLPNLRSQHFVPNLFSQKKQNLQTVVPVHPEREDVWIGTHIE